MSPTMPLSTLDTVARAYALADAYSISDIECSAVAERRGGVRWYDTRPMLDPREHCDEFIDLAQAAIDHALARGLAARHDSEPHLVRITEAGASRAAA